MSITKISAAMTDLDGAVTINESSADADFRVESDGNANAIFLNGGDDRVTFFNSTTVNAASGTDDGVSHYSDGRTDISRASGQPLNIRRRTDDGILQNFYKEASGTVTNVGSISTWSSNVAVGRLNCALLFDDDVNRIKPASVQSSGARDNVIDLGDPSHRFNDVWIGGGIHLGGTGNDNKLNYYEEGTWTPAVAAGGWSIGTTVLANYTRVGKVVHVQCYTSLSGSGNSDDLAISGLPFDVPANTYAVNKLDAEKVNTHGAYVRTAPNTDDVNFLTSEESTSSGRTNLDGNEFGAGYLIFSITYFVS